MKVLKGDYILLGKSSVFFFFQYIYVCCESEIFPRKSGTPEKQNP